MKTEILRGGLVSDLSMEYLKRHESCIIWLESIENIPYVLEYAILCKQREAMFDIPTYRTIKLIGYSALDSTAEPYDDGHFIRRAFWLRDFDRFFQPDGIYSNGCPVGAVDPITVSIKVKGILTSRAWGNYGEVPEN